MTPERIAGLLAGLRVAVRLERRIAPPMVLAEVFLWIAAGVDHSSDLTKVTGVDRHHMSRIVNALTGRGHLREGHHHPTPLCLVTSRPHPHRRGRQLLLSAEGEQLISSTFSSEHLQT